MEYTVIEVQNDIGKFQATVTEYLGEGWKLVGGVAVVCAGNGRIRRMVVLPGDDQAHRVTCGPAWSSAGTATAAIRTQDIWVLQR